MTKLSQISGKELVKVLQKVGYELISQKGSHIKLRQFNPIKITIIVPNHKIIRPGTLNNILKKVGISKDRLKEILKN